MSNYTITNYTKNKAKKLKVQVKPSTNKKKKIDVFKDGKKIATIGDVNYGDFPTFKKLKGKKYADERRRLYKIRHNKHRGKVGTKSYWADQLLW